jgi:hypothetical protein
MTQLADILNATAQPSPVVMGLRLVPYSVGHSLVLHRMGSPLVIGGYVDRANLMEAVLVCSQPVQESLKAMRSPIRNLVIWLWAKRTKRLSFDAEFQKWNDWMAKQSTAPEILSKPGKGRHLAMPWPERMLACCMDIGLQENTVLAMPIGDAERLVLARAETHGDVELWSPKDEELWRWIKQQEATNN